jgi:hypothetical protein
MQRKGTTFKVNLDLKQELYIPTLNQESRLQISNTESQIITGSFRVSMLLNTTRAFLLLVCSCTRPVQGWCAKLLLKIRLDFLLRKTGASLNFKVEG